MYVSWNHLKSSLLKKNMLSCIKELTDDTAAFLPSPLLSTCWKIKLIIGYSLLPNVLWRPDIQEIFALNTVPKKCLIAKDPRTMPRII